VNLAATVPATASQMFSKNITTFFQHLLKDGQVRLDTEDEIIRETLVCHAGQVDHPKVQEALRARHGTAVAGRTE
jgi:NAD(P) transhydrogenase subunit alpha